MNGLKQNLTVLFLRAWKKKRQKSKLMIMLKNSGIEQQAVFKTFLHTTSGLLRKKLMMSYANAFCRLIRMNAWILNYLLLMLKTLL